MDELAHLTALAQARKGESDPIAAALTLTRTLAEEILAASRIVERLENSANLLPKGHAQALSQLREADAVGEAVSAGTSFSSDRALRAALEDKRLLLIKQIQTEDYHSSCLRGLVEDYEKLLLLLEQAANSAPSSVSVDPAQQFQHVASALQASLISLRENIGQLQQRAQRDLLV